MSITPSLENPQGIVHSLDKSTTIVLNSLKRIDKAKDLYAKLSIYKEALEEYNEIKEDYIIANAYSKLTEDEISECEGLLMIAKRLLDTAFRSIQRACVELSAKSSSGSFSVQLNPDTLEIALIKY